MREGARRGVAYPAVGAEAGRWVFESESEVEAVEGGGVGGRLEPYAAIVEASGMRAVSVLVVGDDGAMVNGRAGDEVEALYDGAAAIENASIGDDHPLPLRSMAAFDKAFAAARRDVVADLREAVCCALNEIDAHAVTAELRTYPKPSKMIQKVRGVSRLA